MVIDQGVTLEKLYPLGQTLQDKISLVNIFNFILFYNTYK